jgi:hypothetical protein
MSPSTEGNKERILLAGAGPAAAYGLNSEYHEEPEVSSEVST